MKKKIIEKYELREIDANFYDIMKPSENLKVKYLTEEEFRSGIPGIVFLDSIENRIKFKDEK